MPTSENAGNTKKREAPQPEPDRSRFIYELTEDVLPATENTTAATVHADWITITKWKVRVTLWFLAGMSALSLGAVSLTPVIEVRFIAATVLTSSLIIAGRVLGLGGAGHRQHKNTV